MHRFEWTALRVFIPFLSCSWQRWDRCCRPNGIDFGQRDVAFGAVSDGLLGEGSISPPSATVRAAGSDKRVTASGALREFSHTTTLLPS